MFLQLFKQLFQLPATQTDQLVLQQADSSAAQVLARIALLSQHLLVLVYNAVSRAMFSRDHLSLALHFARHLLPEQFPDAEWAVLLNCSSAAVGGSGGASGGSSGSIALAVTAGAVPSWVGPERMAAYELVALSLPDLVTSARLQDARIWAPWAASAAAGGGTAGGASVPAAVRGALTVLQQLILVAAFQPERCVCVRGGRRQLECQPPLRGKGTSNSQQRRERSAGCKSNFCLIHKFSACADILLHVPAMLPSCCLSFPSVAAQLVVQLLHLPSLHPSPVSMRQLLSQQQQQQQQQASATTSNTCQPVLFVTTAGADPSQELAAFAEAEVGRQQLHEVAMGQGQSEVALQLLKDCAATGGSRGVMVTLASEGGGTLNGRGSIAAL